MTAGSVNPKSGHDSAWWKRRIEYLNRKNCRTGKELQENLNALMEAGVGYLRAAIVKAVFEAFVVLVQQTPVDTGRARAGWQIGTEPTEWVPEKRKSITGAADKALTEALRSVPDLGQLTQADAIHVTNNVEYLLALEAGWSAQAPNGFIGLFLERLRQRLNQLAAAS